MKLTTQNILLDVISVGGAMAGSLMLALNSPASKWGYFFFMGSSLAGTVLLLRSDVRRSQVFINFWFTAVNLIGIVRWFDLL